MGEGGWMGSASAALLCHPQLCSHPQQHARPLPTHLCRPILTDLAFYNRINLRLLRHLHRLLVSWRVHPACLPLCSGACSGVPSTSARVFVRRMHGMCPTVALSPCPLAHTHAHPHAHSTHSHTPKPACYSNLQDLLSGQFNVTLGDKLSEHLKKWIDVGNVLQPPQPVSSVLDCWLGCHTHVCMCCLRALLLLHQGALCPSSIWPCGHQVSTSLYCAAGAPHVHLPLHFLLTFTTSVCVLQVAWAPGQEWEVAAGMLDIFHKLPPQAKKFLETQGEPILCCCAVCLLPVMCATSSASCLFPCQAPSVKLGGTCRQACTHTSVSSHPGPYCRRAARHRGADDRP